MLALGEPAPWFTAPVVNGTSRFSFQSAGGRYVLMLFYGSASRPQSAEALALVDKYRRIFDDMDACFFGVSIDPSDRSDKRISQELPGIRHVLDFKRSVSRAYGAMFPSPKGEVHRPIWLLLDRTMRVIEHRPVTEGEQIINRLIDLIENREPVTDAPILIVPRIFEPELCRELIAYYENGEPAESGYMIERDGKTVGVIDHNYKRRADCQIEDTGLRDRIRERIARALIPMIKRAYQFEVTRIERWIVACYDAEVGGYFNAHRDNTTPGTAHRRFACSINLNTEDYDGGGLCFPEFGVRTYRPPTGGAVIFSCSLLHQALPVTRGRRYVFLPFFYDEKAAEIRRNSNPLLGEDVSAYQG